MFRLSVDRVIVSAVTAVLLVGMLATAAIAAWDWTCNSGDICVYRERDLALPLAATPDNDWDYVGDNYPNTTSPINNSASSVVNYLSTKDVIWYRNSGGTGDQFCVNPNTAVLWVGLFNNDAFSSHGAWTNNSAC
jgi:hypothetical protein